MELRKDPITRSWVITGDDVPDQAPRAEGFCPFCADSPVAAQVVSNMPGVEGGPWSARAVVHPAPLYRIEGEPNRRGEGIYDRMSPVGAHEVLVENPRHDRQFGTQTMRRPSSSCCWRRIVSRISNAMRASSTSAFLRITDPMRGRNLSIPRRNLPRPRLFRGGCCTN